VALVMICGLASECVTSGECDADAMGSNYCEAFCRYLGNLVLLTQVHFLLTKSEEYDKCMKLKYWPYCLLNHALLFEYLELLFYELELELVHLLHMPCQVGEVHNTTGTTSTFVTVNNHLR